METIVLDTGLNDILNYISDTFTVIGIGIGTEELASTITELNSEITTNGGEKGSVDSSEIDTGILTINKLFTFTGSFAVTEAILMDSSDVALIYGVASTTKNVISGDKLLVEFEIEVVEV